EGVKKLSLRKASLLNRVFGRDVVDSKTGEVLVEQGQLFNEEHYELFQKLSSLSFELVQTSGYVQQPTIAVALAQDKTFSQDEALKEIHAKMWPGDASSLK
ncbi:MAG TPA: hypothetical protein PKD74_04595, partial [Candidatus Dependentiae bacterium]|nr:hypothetical protein [Candidatus Dependentiae bacterium]